MVGLKPTTFLCSMETIVLPNITNIAPANHQRIEKSHQIGACVEILDKLIRTFESFSYIHVTTTQGISAS